jgi:probable HAF family extracellular repeat protein
MSMTSHARAHTGRRRVRQTISGATVLAALAVVGWASGQAAPAAGAADSATGSATGSSVAAPASTRFRGFVLDHSRYARFDISATTTKTVAGGSNNRGQIVGGYTDARGEHGFLRDPRGTVATIDVPRARSTSAVKINDRGQIVGYYTQNTPLEDPNAMRRSFLLDRGRFVRIDVPDAVDTQATGVNNRGQVVGQYQDTAGGFHGFRWEHGHITTLDAPGAAASSLVDINDRGQLLDLRAEPNGTFQGFVLDRDRYTTFAAPGAAITAPFDINDRGQIVGSAYTDPAVTARGYLPAKGAAGPFTPINVPGATSTIVGGINDRGLVVGGYQNATASISQPSGMPSMDTRPALLERSVG